jgi:hypothetical protein
VFAISILLGGCVASTNKNPPPRIGTTLGQELIDLEEAREVGALSESEYEAQRARMLGDSNSE